MKLKPDNKDRRLALRILTEGIIGHTNKFKHDSDPGLYSWARVVLSQALGDLEKYEKDN